LIYWDDEAGERKKEKSYVIKEMISIGDKKTRGLNRKKSEGGKPKYAMRKNWFVDAFLCVWK